MVENPKAAAGAAKPSTFAIPPIAELLLGQVMANGARKYGLFNWRDAGIDASTYHDAIRRHLAAWRDRQDIDPESGLPHLAHIMASCAIALDADSVGLLKDDRGTAGTSPQWLADNTRKAAA